VRWVSTYGRRWCPTGGEGVLATSELGIGDAELFFEGDEELEASMESSRGHRGRRGGGCRRFCSRGGVRGMRFSTIMSLMDSFKAGLGMAGRRG